MGRRISEASNNLIEQMKQVVPVEVFLLNEVNLPRTFPGLELLFALDGRGHGGVK